MGQPVGTLILAVAQATTCIKEKIYSCVNNLQGINNIGLFNIGLTNVNIETANFSLYMII